MGDREERVSIEPGRTLLHFRVAEKIGEGGMGEVWKAVDTDLGREVAIKILPAAVAEDQERLLRFEREARLLASLNHPNIATVHGLHRDGDTRFLTMELVRGEDLAKRLASGPLPIEDAVAICRQVADALEAAHEHGVIHRDLKPANVIVGPDGQAKVLDFGLAKSMEEAASSGDPSTSPTLTTPATIGGMILGTAAYMSPEQARGHAVDRRADIWAFGCVLYECLSGARCFTGETISDTLAAVLRAELDWSALPAACPPALERLLHRCLDRDPRRRLRDIGEARVVLEGPLDEPPPAPAPAAGPRSRWAGVGGALLLALLTGTAAWLLKPEPPRPVRKYSAAALAAAAPSEWRSSVGPRVSPDGKRMAVVLEDGIHVRELDDLDTRVVENSEETTTMFWSPDGQWLGFTTGLNLWKVGAGETAPVKITQFSGRVSPAGGGAWLPDGTILVSTGGSGILSVSSQGGDPQPVLDPAEGENDFHEPAALPGGRGIVFLIHGSDGTEDIAVYDGRERRTILHLEGQWLRDPAYSPSGHLLYVATLGNVGIWAVPFSLDSLEATGEPFLVAPGGSTPSVAADGTLFYVQGAATRERQVTVFDRDGAIVRTVAEPLEGLADPALSPDGTRLAVSAEAGSQRDIWILDVRSGTRNRLTFTSDPDRYPRWFPGGDRVAFICGEPPTICIHSADGRGETETLPVSANEALDIDASGRLVIYDSHAPGTRADLRLHHLDGGRDEAFLATPDFESDPHFSPGGDLVAYIAWEVGIEEVFLRQFPDAGGKWQVSVAGGDAPAWSSDEIFWRLGTTLNARTVTTSPDITLGPARTVLRHPALEWGWDVSADGSLIYLASSADGDDTASSIVVVENWFGEFADR